MRPKISVVGSGELARAVSQRLSELGGFDLLVYDRSAPFASEEALGIEASGAIRGQGTVVESASAPSETSESDILILAADEAASPSDIEALAEDLPRMVGHSEGALIVVVEDLPGRLYPMAVSVSGLPPDRIVGTGTLPASARLQVLIAHRLGISAQGVEALAIGRRGRDALPLLRFATASGIPVLDLIAAEEVNDLIGAFQKAQEQQGGPGGLAAQVAAVERIVAAVALGQPDLLPCTVVLEGQYGISGAFVSVPVRLGPGGVEQIVELDLTMDELIPLRHIASPSGRGNGIASQAR